MAERRVHFDVSALERGMNRQNAEDVGTNPLMLRDILLNEYPQLRQRGGYGDVASAGETNTLFGGEVLNAHKFEAIGFNGTIVVTAHSSPAATKIWTVGWGSDGEKNLIKTIDHRATHCDMSPAWAELDDTTRMTAMIFVTDVYAGVMNWRGVTDPHDNWIDINGTASGDPLVDGDGFLYCATASNYTFAVSRVGDESINGAPHWFWYSKIQDATNWNDVEAINAAVPKNGGVFHMPGSKQGDRPTGADELNGDLVIFGGESIIVVQVPDDPRTFNLETRAGIGCSDFRSIAKGEDYLIFANRESVARFTGYDVAPLTGPIQDYYYDLLSGYNDAWRLVGGVVNDHYLLSIIDDNDDYVTTLVCDLSDPNNPAWAEFTNLPLYAICSSAFNRYTYGYMDSGRVINLSKMFTRGGGQDAVGPGPKFRLDLRPTPPLAPSQRGVWRSVRPTYVADGVEQGGIIPKLQVYYTTESGEIADGEYSLLGELPNRTNPRDKKLVCAIASPNLGIRIEADSADKFDKVVLKNIEFSFKPGKRGRT